MIFTLEKICENKSIKEGFKLKKFLALFLALCLVGFLTLAAAPASFAAEASDTPVTVDLSALTASSQITGATVSVPFSNRLWVDLNEGKFIINGTLDSHGENTAGYCVCVFNHAEVVGGNATNIYLFENSPEAPAFPTAGIISGGTFSTVLPLTNLSTISGGSFTCNVENTESRSEITGGIFTGDLDHQCGTVSGGYFKGNVSGFGEIAGGYFANKPLFTAFGFKAFDNTEEDTKADYPFVVLPVYTVKWMSYDGGSVLETDYDQPAGAALSYDGPVPSYPADPIFYYTFSGWSAAPKQDFGVAAEDLPPVTADVIYYASFIKAATVYDDPGVFDVNVAGAVHGSVVSDSARSAAGREITLTVAPDKGFTLETLTVTDISGNEIDLTITDIGKSYTFTMPAGDVTVEATFMEDNTMLNFFVDVPSSAYFYDPVLWAVTNGITNGTDSVHFSPYDTCTRAQAVTFIWRAAGMPVVNYAMPFTDVESDTWYTEAVRWAASLKITSGTTETTFEPDGEVTREQLAVFIYNYAKTNGEGFTGAWMFPLDFNDVQDINDWADEAMHWCVMKGILQGTDNNMLVPGRTATRAETVTMLSRYFEQGK